MLEAEWTRVCVPQGQSWTHTHVFVKTCVLLIVVSLWCLTFAAHNDACAAFDTRILFSPSSAERGKKKNSALTFLNLDLTRCGNFCAHAQRADFIGKQETLCVSLLNFSNEQYLDFKLLKPVKSIFMSWMFNMYNACIFHGYIKRQISVGSWELLFVPVSEETHSYCSKTPDFCVLTWLETFYMQTSTCSIKYIIYADHFLAFLMPKCFIFHL